VKRWTACRAGRFPRSRRSSGRMLLGATYEEEDAPPPYSRDNLESVQCAQAQFLLESNRKILPALNNCFLDGSWHNWRPTPSDDMPIFGPIPSRPSILIATGFTDLGITMAPATASAVADYVFGGVSSFPVVFDPSRFIGVQQAG